MTGSLKEATPIAYQATLDSTVGTKHILTFNLEFERGPGKERLTFTRSKNGEMQLWDLVMNQESDHPITRYNVNIAHKISLSVNTETQAEFRKAWS